MDRASWLQGRRAAVVADYDADAGTYDAEPYPNDAQLAWVARVAASCPEDGVVLDAPCGTGRYFAAITGAGRRVVGIDQSAGMLGEAEAKGLATALHHTGLQELAFDAAFDASVTIDAMENVPPEDWPLVLANLRRAVRPGGLVYLTVEEQDDEETDAAFAGLVAAGLPAVRGEVTEGDVAGYHFYPGRERVLGWIADAALAVVDEGVTQHDGWGYRHLLLRRPS